MNNDSTRQERIFKIFTPVRCLNRDQLPRYLNGNMTDWEKHLIEQHLVDCDLCHEAIESLQNISNQEPYERLSKQLSLYLQREYVPVEQQSPLKTRRTVQGTSTSESLLSYFWVIMFLTLGGGSIFLLQQHLKNRPALAAMPVKTTDAIVPPQQSAPQMPTQTEYLASETKPPVIQTQYSTKPKDTATTLKTPQLKLTAKDSALLAAATKKNAVKDTIKKAPAVTDTNLRTPPKAAEPEVKAPPKEEKTVAATPPPAPAPKEKEKEKEEEPAKSAPTGDESLFRAAMLYQQQGNVNEAIDQFRKLSTNYKFSERAKYQLALCYRTKGQNGKARRLLREIVRMEGPLKAQAQTELNNLN